MFTLLMDDNTSNFKVPSLYIVHDFNVGSLKQSHLYA